MEEKIYNGKKTAFSINDVVKLDSHMQKNGTGPLSYTMYKNKFKMDYRLNCKM